MSDDFPERAEPNTTSLWQFSSGVLCNRSATGAGIIDDDETTISAGIIDDETAISAAGTKTTSSAIFAQSVCNIEYTFNSLPVCLVCATDGTIFEL